MIDISNTMNLDELIFTEDDFKYNSKDMSEDEINELCNIILENKKLGDKFKETDLFLNLTTKLTDKDPDDFVETLNEKNIEV